MHVCFIRLFPPSNQNPSHTSKFTSTTKLPSLSHPPCCPSDRLQYQIVCHQILMLSCIFSSSFNGYSCFLPAEGMCSLRSGIVSYVVTQTSPHHLAVCQDTEKTNKLLLSNCFFLSVCKIQQCLYYFLLYWEILERSWL